MLAESDEAFGQALELIAPDDDDAQAAAWVRRGHWLRGGICHPRESLRSYRAALDFLRPRRRRRPADPGRVAGRDGVGAGGRGRPGEADKLLVEAGELLERGSAEAGGGARFSRLSHDVDVARAHALLRAGRFTESYAPLIAASRRGGPRRTAGSRLQLPGERRERRGVRGRPAAGAGLRGPLPAARGAERAAAAVRVHALRADRAAAAARPAGEARVACDAAAAAAERVGLPELEGLVHHDRGLLATAAGEHQTAASELGLALDLGAPVSRPLARLLRAEALARAGRPDDAERELRAVALEPVSPADLPDTLVARMSHVQGLIALAAGKRAARRQAAARSGIGLAPPVRARPRRNATATPGKATSRRSSTWAARRSPHSSSPRGN